MIIGGAVLAMAIVALAVAGGTGTLSSFEAIVLGAVEGITEYLPVSSTGHLLVTQRLMDLDSGAADVYAIAIQVGAILAVVALYRQRIVQIANGVIGRDQGGRDLLVRLAASFVPAAAIGVVFEHPIKDNLFGPGPVVAAWAVGGAFLLWWKPRHGTTTLLELSVRSAVIIGLAQSLALWPGVSRSLVTLVAALFVGLDMASAVEYSFLLGLATLTAATALDLVKDGGTLLDEYGWRTPVLGVLVAFVTAVVAVRWLVTVLRTRSLAVFGWYRLGIATVTLVLMLTDTI